MSVLIYFFIANELARTRGLFLPSGLSDNPRPASGDAASYLRTCGFLVQQYQVIFLKGTSSYSSREFLKELSRRVSLVDWLSLRSATGIFLTTSFRSPLQLLVTYFEIWVKNWRMVSFDNLYNIS